MTNTVRVSHSTVYKYPKPVMLGPQTFRLCPRKDARALIREYELKIRPVDDNENVTEHEDEQNNSIVKCVFPELVDALEVDVEIVAELRRPAYYPSKNWLPMRMARAINRDITYAVRMSPGVQTPEETLKLKTGSCRDFAWLLFNDLQQTKFEARYVSGYLIQEEKQEGDLHAWCEVKYGDDKWVGVDPTLGSYVGAGHLPLSVGPHYSCTAPISGVCEATEVEFSYSVEVAQEEWEEFDD
jgi:transglutaminase-like putative cysteine protease